MKVVASTTNYAPSWTTTGNQAVWTQLAEPCAIRNESYRTDAPRESRRRLAGLSLRKGERQTTRSWQGTRTEAS